MRNEKPNLNVSPAIVSDQTSFAITGLDARQFRDLVKAEHIPHRVVGRRLLVLVKDFEKFVAVGSSDPAAAPPATDAEDVVDVLRRLGKKLTVVR